MSFSCCDIETVNDIATDNERAFMSRVDNSLELKPVRPNKLCLGFLLCLLVSLDEA